ncbi:MAG: hypothetical protein KQI81_15045 [Deltaproteobacteria bacterium]|nr:hypothetical protein [Deltaproteobacteria bacterium]
MESIKNHAVSVERIAFMIQTGPGLSVWAMVLRKRVKSAPLDNDAGGNRPSSSFTD